MIHKLSSRPVVLALVVLALIALSVPVLAQDGGSDWLTTSDRGMVGISAPAADAALSGVVDIEGTAQSNTFSYYKVEYSVDGAAWVSVVDNYKIQMQVAEGVLASWDTTTVDNGAYWLRAVVVDNTGNYVASEPVAVTVANEAAEEEVAEEVVAEEEAVVEEPAAAAEEEAAVEEAAPAWVTSSDRGMVGISAPAADATVSGVVDIEGTAQSNAFNYYKVEYSVDSAAWVSVVAKYKHTTQVGEGVLASWDTTTVDNGVYWLRAVVVDNTGNYVASEPVAVTVANEAAEEEVAEEVVAEEEAVVEEPAAVAEEEAAVEEAAPAWVTSSDRGMVGISAPAADAVLTGEADIEGTAQSNTFSYYKVEYSVDGAAWVSVVAKYKHTTQVAEGVLASWDTTTVGNGAYWLRAVVVDNTGNYVASEPVAVTVAN